MKQQLRLLLLTLLCAVGSATWADTVTDELNLEFTGVTGNSYADWSDKTGTSGAVYAGQSAGGNESIQLRSKNSNSGVITTTSGGKVSKITVEWNSNTSSGGTLNVYGKNTAYSAATDLYDSSTQGTLLGTIVYGTSTELTVSGDYEYIGLRSKSGAIYLTSISIEWEQTAAATVAMPVITPESSNFFQQKEVTITADEGCTIRYTTDGTDPTVNNGVTPNNNPFTFFINETTTVKAIAIKDGESSEMAEATFNLVVPEISFSPNALEISCDGETGTLDIISNLILENMYSKTITFEYFDPDSNEQLQQKPSWLNLEVSEDYKTLSYDVEANETENSRKVIVRIYFNIKEVENYPATSGVYAEVTINQGGSTGIVYSKYSGNLIEGDYIIYYNNKAMKNTVTSNRLDYEEVTPVNDKIRTSDNTIVWHIAPNGNYYTIKNTVENKYAAGNGTKNQAALIESGTDDGALWTVTGTTTYDFVNKKNDDKGVNANLRNNTTYGFACYGSGTGGALTLYKSAAEYLQRPVISPESGEFIDAQEVTITAGEGCAIYYTLDGSEPTTESTQYGEPFTIEATTTVKAIAVKDGENSVVAEATFTKIEYVPIADARTQATGDVIVKGIVTSATGSNYYIQDNTAAIYLYNVSSVTLNEGDEIVVKGTLDTYHGLLEIKNVSIKKIVSTGNTIEPTNTTLSEIFTDADNMLQSKLIEITEAIVTEVNENDVTISQNNYSILVYHLDAGEQTIEVGNMITLTGIIGCYDNPRIVNAKDVTVTSVPITATFKKKFMGYTSIYYSDKNLVVPENVTAHTYKVEGGKGSYSMDYEAGAVIPKGTGVILEYSDKDIPDEGITVTLEETTEEGTADSNNMLRGFDEAQETTVDEGENPKNYYFYRYTVGTGSKSNKIGFYFANEDGSQFTAGAHKIYLAVLKSQFEDGVNASCIEDDTTGIDEIVAGTTQKGTYTLSGIQISTEKLPKGIYIVNGKKMVIK